MSIKTLPLTPTVPVRYARFGMSDVRIPAPQWEELCAALKDVLQDPNVNRTDIVKTLEYRFMHLKTSHDEPQETHLLVPPPAHAQPPKDTSWKRHFRVGGCFIPLALFLCVSLLVFLIMYVSFVIIPFHEYEVEQAEE